MNETILPSFSKEKFWRAQIGLFWMLFWTGDVSPRFQSQGGLLAYMLYWLHIVPITSGASMVANHIPYMHFSAEIGLK